MAPATRRKNRTDVARQIILPWRKSVVMAVNSLRLRFFRSLITLFSLALAIAFLSYTLVNTAFARESYRLHGEAVLPRLVEQGYRLDAAAGAIAAGPSEIWLILLSLLVCTVGIVNAQLMSVTERFREIGIMKCLGALDLMILRLFLIEAVLVGILGAGAGAVLGLLAAWAVSLAGIGDLGFSGLSILPLLAEAGKACAAGIGLSVLGVLYPALLAARLQPILVMKEEY
jgi:hypothetical protein